jgi:hypothetical protein
MKWCTAANDVAEHPENPDPKAKPPFDESGSKRKRGFEEGM